jgi:hypothetical protein
LFVGFLKIIDYIKFKVNQIYLKQAKIIQDVMSIHYQKINCNKIILVITIGGEEGGGGGGGLLCFKTILNNLRRLIFILE